MTCRPKTVTCPRCTLTAAVVERHNTYDLGAEPAHVMRCEQLGCARRYHTYDGTVPFTGRVSVRVDPEYLAEWLEPETRAYAKAGETKDWRAKS